MSETRSGALPLTGGCNCGAVRFEVRAPFETAGYCHCVRCQRRSGCASSPGGMVSAAQFAVVAGADVVATWRPEGGKPKSFCARCGGHLFSGDPHGGAEETIGVRLGALDGDPGIRPQWHQWVASAPAWEPLPDDGLPRFDGPRPR
ncbi:GFA family protein [Conexibacter arvalis]|uniref:CENP-V/GFA domain-containing protein n=1 Tax=Conexibacter arvalis TaxID=912552 RepID=A0A840ILI5_9ACTN|nr:GFA family protein [Conexibacter arvalis]MBB4665003.1 hypothetical protein [Conexibacter arvalis]